MKPTEYEMKQLLEQEARLRKFKEANFTQCGYDEPDEMVSLCMAFSIPVFGQIVLIGWLLKDLAVKWFRMLLITLNAFWLYMVDIFRKLK